MKTILTIAIILTGLTAYSQSFYRHRTDHAIINCESIEHGHNIVYKAKTKREYRQKRKAMELFTKGKRSSLKRKGKNI